MTEPVAPADAAPRPLMLFGLALTGVFAGSALGALTNAINGRISPRYFVAVLGWEGVRNVWRASIAQGILEGVWYGVLFSLIYVVGVAIITRGACSYGFAARYLLGIVAGAFVCWLVGGAAAMALAALSPEFYRRTFMGAPEGLGRLLAYAWVGGSIWGVQLGGWVSVALGLALLHAAWVRLHGRPQPEARPGTMR